MQIVNAETLLGLEPGAWVVTESPFYFELFLRFLRFSMSFRARSHSVSAMVCIGSPKNLFRFGNWSVILVAGR